MCARARGRDLTRPAWAVRFAGHGRARAGTGGHGAAVPGAPAARDVAWDSLRYTLYAPPYDLAVARLPLFRRGRHRSLALAAVRPLERRDTVSRS